MHKGSFEDHLLLEFKAYADGMLSKINEQNILLRYLVKINKSGCISFSVLQNLNIIYETSNIYLQNDHSDVLKQKFNKLKLFNDLYSYEKFEHI